MTPEERRQIYPYFIVREMEREEPVGFNRPNVTNFPRLITTTWIISDKDYQERFWIRQEAPLFFENNYTNTVENFLNDCWGVLRSNEYSRVSMTDMQREMLKRLYHMMEEFYYYEEESPLIDDEIIEHPKFDKCRKYAKLVYQELSGDDLDSWGKSRLKQIKPLKIARKKITIAEYIAEDSKIYPHYLLKYNEKAIGDSSEYNPLSHFLRNIWEISSKDFQERFWVRKEYPIYDDKNCMKTVAKFFYNTDNLMHNEKYITPKQNGILQKLYSMLKDFEKDPNRPENPGYGINDAAIIEDPMFDKCRRYAKFVYEELSGDDLDAWGKSRPKQN